MALLSPGTCVLRASRPAGLQELRPASCHLCVLPTASLYEPCARRVSEVLQDKVHRTEEVKHVEFYAFSYYYDLAASVGLIGKNEVGPTTAGAPGWWARPWGVGLWGGGGGPSPLLLTAMPARRQGSP